MSRELEAGREMDMLISEWMGGNFRPYSTDIAAAMQVVAKFRGFINIERRDTPLETSTGVTWKVTLPGRSTNFVNATAATLPEAICLAARAAVESNEP